MAVTHADIEIGRSRREVGTAVIALCVFCGLLGFVFSALAEFSKTKVSWVVVTSEGGKERLECIYSRNGQAALLCGVGAFLTLAMAMIVQNGYIWAAVTKEKQEGTIWDVHSSTGLLAKQAALLFLAAWVCFGVAEVLLVIGISVECTHLGRWRDARNQCIVVRRGSFLAAGFLDLSTVFLSTAFYFVVLKMKRVKEGEAAIQREVAEAAESSISSIVVVSSPNSAQELEGENQESTSVDRVQIVGKTSNLQ